LTISSSPASSPEALSTPVLLDQVFFGATVTYAHEQRTERTVTIVGVDKADLDCPHVSWVSPIARALMKAREGDILELRTLAGIEHIEVLD